MRIFMGRAIALAGVPTEHVNSSGKFVYDVLVRADNRSDVLALLKCKPSSVRVVSGYRQGVLVTAIAAKYDTIYYRAWDRWFELAPGGGSVEEAKPEPKKLRKLPVDELLRLACVYAEQDRLASIDACAHVTDMAESVEADRAFVAQVKAYRLKRWGRTRLEVALGEGKLRGLEEIKAGEAVK